MSIRQFKQLFFTMMLLASGTVYAENNYLWKLTPLMGVHSPVLEDLNEREFKSDVPLRGTIIIDAETSEDVDVLLVNKLPAMKAGALAGIELATELDERSDFIFGLGSWESGAASLAGASLPFQGLLYDAAYERSAKVSYFEYYLGLRRYFNEKNEKKRWYYKGALHQLFDIDYEEKLVFAFRSAEGETFKRITVINAQTTGVIMAEAGLGLEYRASSRYSFALDIGYMFGLGTFRLGDASLKSDFLINDNVNIKLPVAPSEEKQLGYLLDDYNTYRLMELKMDGWKVMVGTRVHF